jgi:hypothetical protein
MNEDTYSVQFLGLDQQLRTVAKSDLVQFKVEPTSKMPSYRGKLNGEQVRNLVAYLSSLRPRGGTQ